MSKKILSKFLILAGFLSFYLLGCAEASIFSPIPLDTNNPVLAQPIFMAMDETNARAYLINSNNVVDFADASLLVLNLTNPTAPTVLNAISLPNFSGQATLDGPNKRLILTNRLSSGFGDNVDPLLVVNIDESSPNFLSIQSFNADSNPFGITSDGTNLYVTNEGSLDRFLLSNLNNRTQVVFNLQNTQGRTLNTGNTREVAISPSGNFLVVTNRDDRVLLVNSQQIPLPDPTLELTLGGSEAVDYALGDTFSTRGVTSDSNFIYVVEGSPPALKILSDNLLPLITGNPVEILISAIAVAEIPIGNDPNEIALDTLNNRAYVALTQDNAVSVIDTTQFVEINRISLVNNLPAGVDSGNAPFGVSVGHFGGTPYIYVLNLNSNNVSIINGNTLSVVASFP